MTNLKFAKLAKYWPLLKLIIGLCIVGALYYYLSNVAPLQPKPPVGLNVIAAPAPQVKKLQPVDKPIKSKSVKVYPASVKHTINLPEIVKNNPALDVFATSQVPADDHPQTVTTLINTDTGESQTFVKRDPLPWLAFDKRGEAGLYLGIKNAEPTARIEVKQGVLQVKALHLGLIGSVDQPLSGAANTDYFIGAGVWAKW